MTFPAEDPNGMDATAGFRGWLLALGVSLATSLLVIAPSFWMGNASGHDFGFHAASWLDVAGQWKERIFFPRWTEWANYGFGEPRFVFYPPLSWMLGAALGFVFPWNAVPGIFIVIAQTVAGLCSFALARRFLPGRAALFGAACYAANPYALLIVYMRSDFAELLACTLMPLVVLTALQLCGLAKNRRRYAPRAMAFFAVVFAAVWLSNAPAGVMASYSVAILLMVMTGIAGIAVHRGIAGERESGEARKLWRVLLLLSAAATILMIRPSSVFWEHLPKLRFVQFPWRWMAILAVPYAYFVAAAVASRRMRWIWIVLVLVAAGGTATFLVQRAWWDSEDIPVLQEAIAKDQGFEGTDEYDPAGDDHYNLPEKAPRVQVLPTEESAGSPPKAEIHIERWTAEERNLQVTSNEPVRVALRLLDYPAWRVEVNGKAVTPQHAETNGEMILSLSAGREHLAVRLVRTPDRKLGVAISMIAMLTLLAMLNAGGLRLLSASP